MGCDRSYRHGQDGRFRADGRVLVRLSDSVVTAIRMPAGLATVADVLTDPPDDGDFPDAPEGIAALAGELALLAEDSAQAMSKAFGTSRPTSSPSNGWVGSPVAPSISARGRCASPPAPSKRASASSARCRRDP